jgi:hypothetical protein
MLHTPHEAKLAAHNVHTHTAHGGGPTPVVPPRLNVPVRFNHHDVGDGVAVAAVRTYVIRARRQTLACGSIRPSHWRKRKSGYSGARAEYAPMAGVRRPHSSGTRRCPPARAPSRRRRVRTCGRACTVIFLPFPAVPGAVKQTCFQKL